MYDIITLTGMKVAELRAIAEKLEVTNLDKLKKQDLIYKIIDVQAMRAEAEAPSTPAPTQGQDENKNQIADDKRKAFCKGRKGCRSCQGKYRRSLWRICVK
jgi:hypothetical protein